MNNFKTPILFLIFNRPDTTERVFAEIRKAKPKYLFIASDGPRENKEGEKEIVEKTRKMILDMIDWDCEVRTLFREKNLGCKYAVSGAINWFFDQVEEGIILEDDCLPAASFFRFCEELLERYREDERVMMISGDNFQFGWKNNSKSYYFSKYCHIWGWATWKRAWQKYDLNMTKFDDFTNNKAGQLFEDKKEKEYWMDVLSRIKEGKVDTWDYQWVYSVWENDGLCVLPNINLISNIGCDLGTHTSSKTRKSKVADMKIEEINFPINHPSGIEVNTEADKRFFNRLLRIKFLISFILKIKKWIIMN